jgi:hypothetical protein
MLFPKSKDEMFFDVLFKFNVLHVFAFYSPKYSSIVIKTMPNSGAINSSFSSFDQSVRWQLVSI